jgi:hypothetical protein
MDIKYLPWIAGGLAMLYMNAGGNPSGKTTIEKYPLPNEINVVETDLPYNFVTNSFGNIEKILQTKDIPFDKHFYIKTDRYNFTKNQDWLPSRLIGHITSLPVKLFFWDWQVGWGPDGERSQAMLSMLEKNKNIKDITVRMNYNEAIYDMYRMFTEPKLRERNPFFARATLGVLSSIGGELMAELNRGDYYNPFTSTAVNYSNVEAIGAHEIGHHMDFRRFDTDWIYSLSRAIPPIMVFQEGAASMNAKDKLLSKADFNQAYRYLLPAFLVYCLGAYRIMFGKKKKK